MGTVFHNNKENKQLWIYDYPDDSQNLLLRFVVHASGYFHIRMELPKLEQLTVLNTANILFLGLGASAMCFVSWNSAVRILGTVQTSVYIYAVPVVTTLASVWILKETVTIIGVIGIVMIVLGLLLSQNRKGERVWRKTENASW